MKKHRKKKISFQAAAGTSVGCLVFFVILLIALRFYIAAVNARHVDPVKAQSPFDAKRAFALLREIADIGPRPSGSPSLEKVREILRKNLKEAGLAVEEQHFTADTPNGPVPMVNLWGVVKGDQPGVIIIGTHYESKNIPDVTFIGANDGGSTTAWMLEFARVMGASRHGRTLWLCFFDGEECYKQWTATDSLYGSREFVRQITSKGLRKDVQAMINVDMIGDCYLAIKKDRDAPDWLSDAIWSTAGNLGHEACFLPFAGTVQDDHIPFRRAGIPAIDVIDFLYGKTEEEHNLNWHTERDTVDRICPDSLQIVGDVLYHALPQIEKRLNMENRG